MAQTTLENSASGLAIRTAINDNFSELYGVNSRVLGLTAEADITSPLTTAWNHANGALTESPVSTLAHIDIARGTVELPPGIFRFSGDALTRGGSEAPGRLVGAGSGQTAIILDNSDYLFRIDDYKDSLHIEGLTVFCFPAKGMVRTDVGGTGVNVGGDFTFIDVHVIGMDECPINQNGTDTPHWHLERCKFIGKIGGDAIGPALQGYKDRSYIGFSDFHHLKHNIKIAVGPSAGDDKGPGCNFILDNLDMTRFGGSDPGGASYTQKISDIWLEPNPDTYVNAGNGTRLTNLKFANEGFVAAEQMKVLIADVDESSGTDNGSRNTHATTESTGWVNGLTIDASQCQWLGGGRALIYSYTKNISGLIIGPDMLFSGDNPEYGYVQFDPVVSDGRPSPDLAANIFYAPRCDNGSQRLLKLLERPIGEVIDPVGDLQWDHSIQPAHSNGQDLSYINLLTSDTPHTNGAMGGSGSVGSLTDATVGARAATITFGSQDDYFYMAPVAANMVAGRLAFIAAQFKRAASTPIDGVLFTIRDSVPNYYKRIPVWLQSDGWRAEIIDWVPPDNSSTYRIEVSPLPGLWSDTTKSVGFAQPAAYHATGPLVTGRFRTYGLGTFNDGLWQRGNTRCWTDGFNRERVKVGSDPGSATDGNLVEWGLQSTTRGDADATVSSGSTPQQRFTTTLTADRTCSLPTSSLFNGMRYRITRPASGAFNLNVKQGATTVKALPASSWGEFICDGTNWFLSAYGSL